ncbi:MAG: branched-chain amino acid transporter AzlD [Lachnospiraceae bacterium]|nr:branched-chain amino acid transporter AzlD [Lachnospiraceae bacterium]
MNNIHSGMLVAVMAFITFLLRALPFVIFGGKRKTPAYITYLSDVLPCAIIGMLVVYCLRNIEILSSPHGLPELAACAVVAGLHLWRKNTLLSITAGTVVYMVLVQMVF